MGLAMSQVSRRRADQLCDLMRVLKLCAVDLDAGASLAKKRLGECLDHAGLPRAGGSKKQKVPYWAAGRIQSRQEHLIDFGDFFDGGVLSHDLAAQGGFEIGCVVAAKSGIEGGIKTGFHMYCIPLKIEPRGPNINSVRWVRAELSCKRKKLLPRANFLP